MLRPLQSGRAFQVSRAGGRQPAWLRLVAVLCLAVVCVASTAQVCHAHPDATPLSKSAPQNGPAQDHCPLCVAMHSALPATIHVAHEPVRQVQRIAPRPVDSAGSLRWSFDLFSRPPPALPASA